MSSSQDIGRLYIASQGTDSVKILYTRVPRTSHVYSLLIRGKRTFLLLHSSTSWPMQGPLPLKYMIYYPWIGEGPVPPIFGARK